MVAVAVVGAQVELGVQVFEQVGGQQVVAQQQLFEDVAGRGALQEAGQVHGLPAVEAGALDDDVGFGDVAVRRHHAPVQDAQHRGRQREGQHRLLEGLLFAFALCAHFGKVSL